MSWNAKFRAKSATEAREKLTAELGVPEVVERAARELLAAAPHLESAVIPRDKNEVEKTPALEEHEIELSTSGHIDEKTGAFQIMLSIQVVAPSAASKTLKGK